MRAIIRVKPPYPWTCAGIAAELRGWYARIEDPGMLLAVALILTGSVGAAWVLLSMAAEWELFQ